MKTFISEKSCKLSKFLLEKYECKLSFTKLNVLLRNKDIKINGVRTKKDVVLSQGDKVEVYYDGETVSIKPQIIFEDDNILVVNKPKGITSESYYDAIKSLFSELYFCHRLDRNTDGVMLFAKTQKAFEEVVNGFKEKQFEKTYIAEVYGKLSNANGRLVHYLSKDSEKSLVKVFSQPQKDTKIAILEYTVIDSNENSSKVEILLLTGRTHQIRAQMSAIGHFVLGDGKYGNDYINKSLGIKEMRLSSVKVTLHFPKNSILNYLEGATFNKI